ncbi:hypothetical protein Tco_0471684 [Tanacetum coccineum]
MKVVKNKSKTLWILKIEDDLFTYETPLGMTFNEFNRLSGMDDDLFDNEMGILRISYPPHVEQQCDDPEYYNDLDIYESRICYDKNEKIYVEAVIFVNKMTIEQWLDLMYGDHKIVDRTIKEKVISKWLIQSYKKQSNEYIEIKKQWMTHGIDTDMKYDPSDVDFAEWIALNFSNHSTMDWYTKNTLWMYWIRGDDEEVLTDKELSDLEETHVNEDDEVAKIFKIKTNIFNFETSLCKAFNEFNYLLKIDTNLLIHDIPGFKHTMNIKTHGSMNRIKIYHGFLKNHDDHLVSNNARDYANKEEEQYKERGCDLLRNPHMILPTCKIERFKVIKYSFGPAEEFFAIKECGYDDWIRTKDDACHAYRDMFTKINEGWFVTRAE